MKPCSSAAKLIMSSCCPSNFQSAIITDGADGVEQEDWTAWGYRNKEDDTNLSPESGCQTESDMIRACRELQTQVHNNHLTSFDLSHTQALPGWLPPARSCHGRSLSSASHRPLYPWKVKVMDAGLMFSILRCLASPWHRVIATRLLLFPSSVACPLERYT